MSVNALQYIKQHITKENICSLLERYGAKNIVKNGDSYRCTCPLHHGNNPTAFVINHKNGLWYCWTGDCGGGDIFDFVADVHDLSVEHEFKTVISTTADELGLDIANLEMGERSSAVVKENRQWLEFMSKRQIKNNPPFDIVKLGEQYIVNSYRNFTKETIDHFEGRYSYVFNRFVIPLFDKNGAVVGVSMRRIDESEKSKWLHRPKHVSTRTLLYNANNVISDKPLYIVEGAFDVWNLYQLGVTNVVATLGAHLTDEQKQMILECYIDVILAYDSDEAGKTATKSAIELLQHCCNLSILDLCSYHDPGDIPDIETFNTLKLLKPHEWLKKEGLK